MEIENRNKIAQIILAVIILVFFEAQILYLFKLVKNISVAKNQTANQSVQKNEGPKNLGARKDDKNAFGIVEKIEGNVISLKAGEKTLKANITKATKIASFSMTNTGKRVEAPISQNEIRAGDSVVIKAADTITGNEFSAADVFVITP